MQKMHRISLAYTTIKTVHLKKRKHFYRMLGLINTHLTILSAEETSWQSYLLNNKFSCDRQVTKNVLYFFILYNFLQQIKQPYCYLEYF